jgi:hypothetical protein
VIGTNIINGSYAHTKKIKITAIIMHPNFIMETFVNDIALFYLKKAVRYNDYIQPICLPFDVFQKLDQNTKCFVSGWGRTKEEGNYSLNLLIPIFLIIGKGELFFYMFLFKTFNCFYSAGDQI